MRQEREARIAARRRGLRDGKVESDVDTTSAQLGEPRSRVAHRSQDEAVDVRERFAGSVPAPVRVASTERQRAVGRERAVARGEGARAGCASRDRGLGRGEMREEWAERGGQVEPDRARVDRLDARDRRRIVEQHPVAEGPAAIKARHDGGGVERRAIVESHAVAERECPAGPVVGDLPPRREPGADRPARGIERHERLIDLSRGEQGRSIGAPRVKRGHLARDRDPERPARLRAAWRGRRGDGRGLAGDE